jgi:hypothetical protein
MDKLQKSGKLKEPDPKTELDKMVEHMSGRGEELTPKASVRMIRLNYIHSQIMMNRSDKDIVNTLIYLYKIQKTQAYKDLHDCRYVHGSFLTVDKGYEIYQLLQNSTQSIRMAIENNDLSQLVKAISARTKVLDLIPEKADIPWEKFAPSNYFMLLQFGEGHSVSFDLSKFDQMNPEEAEKLISEIKGKAIDATFEELESQINAEDQ